VSNPQRINPAQLYDGAPYDYASVAPPGSVIFTAGACPLDAQGKVVAPGDYESQARQALANLVTTLTAAGSSLGSVLKTTVYVVAADRSDLVRVWTVVQERFAPARPPSTLLGIRLLGYADQLVEIEAIATADDPLLNSSRHSC
jgi:enamine deaminase RidA (YjgF/YER057c/UK114 family)